MFDFLGAIPIHGKPVKKDSRPFGHLHGREEICFTESALTVGRQNWWLLRHGDQNSFFQDEDIAVLLHGNCYPRLYGAQPGEKTKLTTGAIAARYRQSGKDLAQEIKGSFVLVIIDGRKNSVLVFTDPLNLRTAYYTTYGGQLLIATSLTAVSNYLTQNGHPPKLDRRAVMDHHLFDFTLDDRTYLQDVREVPPGAVLSFADGKLETTQYFDPFRHFDLSGPRLNRQDGAAQVKAVLADNIQLYNEGPERTAIALTGGFDSRSIAALLDESVGEYTFYSYGKRSSWDLKIPQLIADRLKLKYQPIYLDDEYPSVFSAYSKLAVLLSDGAAEFTHANIAYVYANYLRDKGSILTGLFGSELIKTPSSRGLFLDTHTIELLNSIDPVKTMDEIFKRMDESGEKLPFYNADTREETIEMIRDHPFLNNDLPLNEKYFHYLLMVGVRKYFRKETKIQRVWKSNLHPFFDLEFIDKLLETPFPWVYNFSQEKSLIKNISIHKLYGAIINEIPALGDILSTHGYRPRYLLQTAGLPLLAYEYFIHKKNISKSSSLDFQRDLAFDVIRECRDYLFTDTQLDRREILLWQVSRPKAFLKLASLQYWLKSIGLGI